MSIKVVSGEVGFMVREAIKRGEQAIVKEAQFSENTQQHAE